MLLDMVILAESVPATGDNFPAAKLIIIGLIAVAAMVIAGLVSRKKDGEDDN